MKQTRSLRHNAATRSVASPSSPTRHQQSASGAADKSYDTVLSKAAAKHAFELSIASSSSVNENGYTMGGGLNRASSTKSGERQQRSTVSRELSTRTGSYRRSVQSETGLSRSKSVGLGMTSVRGIGGKECKSGMDGLTLSRSASVGANGFARARSVQSLRSGGITRSETLASRCSVTSLVSTPTPTATRQKSFLRGGDEFAEVEYRNNPRLLKTREKKIAAEAKKVEKVEKKDTIDTDRGSNAFIKGFKKMFNFASSNAKNAGTARQPTDEDDRGTYTGLTTTSQFTSLRSNISGHSPIPPQQVSSRQAYYRPVSYAGYPLSRRTSFAQSMRRVHVDDGQTGSFEVTMPPLGILKDKTNSNIQDTSMMTSRMSSYTSTDPFLSNVAREMISDPPLQPTQPLRTKPSLLRKHLARHLTPNHVYSAIVRRIQNQDKDTASRYSPAITDTPATIIRREEQTLARRSPATWSSVADPTRNQVAAMQLSQSNDMRVNYSDSSRGLRKEPTTLSTIRVVDTESRGSVPNVFDRQNLATIAAENSNSANPPARSDGLNLFFSASNTDSGAAAVPLVTEPHTPLTPQRTGNTAASWASANPFRAYNRPQEISGLFPYYGVTTRATSTTTSEAAFSRFRAWQHGNVQDSPQALHTNPGEDTIIFRGGTASLSHSGATAEVRVGENEQGARLVERTLRDSISDAVDMQFGAAW
ncbi:hypothetical protein V1509DRAFT_622873 [Lipomyces kononenkoae]